MTPLNLNIVTENTLEAMVFAFMNPLTWLHHVTSAFHLPPSGLLATCSSALSSPSQRAAAKRSAASFAFSFPVLFWQVITICGHIHFCCEKDNPIHNSI